MSIEEAGPALIAEALITTDDLEQTLIEMEAARNDPTVLALGPRMSQVWARKS